MNCPNCGTYYTENEKICKKCHTPLSNAVYNQVSSGNDINQPAPKRKSFVPIVAAILICCLIAGVERYTENITVRSIVGRFLEHSRIFIFGRDGKEQKIYIGSADYMPRNTIRRVEVAAPVEDERLKKRIREIFRTLMSDNTKARVMQSDGTYVRLTPAEGEEPVCAQEVLYDDAYKRLAEKEVKQERMRKNREKGKAKASAKKKTTAKRASSAGKGKTRGRS